MLPVRDSTIPESSEFVVRPLAGNDPARNKELLTFLEKEAAAFNTTVQIENLVLAVKKNQIQVLFLLAGGETVGCATQFPTAIPQWNRDKSEFYFLPAVHSEDMVVNRKGSGTPFMRRRVTMAGNEGPNGGFDLGGMVRAGALVGEQRWHGTADGEGTAIGGLLSKFGTEMAKNRSDAVLSLSDSELAKIRTIPDIEAFSLAHPETGTASLTARAEVFAVTWRPTGVGQIAATFARGISTFSGHSVIRVHVCGNGNLANDPDVESAIANILARGRAQVLCRRWIEKTVDPLNRMYVHALGEIQIRRALRALGARDRLLGDYVMHPLIMKFANIPSAMAMDLTDAAPFVPIHSEWLAI